MRRTKQKTNNAPTLTWLEQLKQDTQCKEHTMNLKVHRELEKPVLYSITERVERERAERSSKKPKEREVFILGQGRKRVDASLLPRERREQY